MAVTKLEDLLRQSTCSRCGGGVYLDEHGEGRVHCEGCKIATYNCTCEVAE